MAKLSKKDSKKVDGSLFVKMLNKVYLGGVIPEAIMNFDTGVVDAVDVTNSLFLHIRGECQLPGLGEIGLGDLSLLCKYLDSFQGKLEISKKDNRLSFKAANDNGQLQYLCQNTEFIATGVKGVNLGKKLFDPCIVKIALEKSVCQHYITYFNLTKIKAVEFLVDNNGRVTIKGGLESEHKFILELGECEFIGKKKDMQDFSVKVYAHYVSAVFNVLSWTEGGGKPVIMMAPKHPLLLKQSDDEYWALLPLNVETEE